MSGSIRVMVSEEQIGEGGPATENIFLADGNGKEFFYLKFPTAAMERAGDGGLFIFFSGSTPTGTETVTYYE